MEQLLAQEGGVLDVVEEAELDGGVGEVRESDGFHCGGDSGDDLCEGKPSNR